MCITQTRTYSFLCQNVIKSGVCYEYAEKESYTDPDHHSGFFIQEGSMSLSRHFKWCSTVALIVTLLGGCIPYPRERQGYIDLCQSDYTFNVDSPSGKQKIVLKTYLYDHAIPVINMSRKRSPQSYETGPEAISEFYVQLIAYNQGRQRPSRPGSKGLPPVSIMLDTRKAYIDEGDGKLISARPEVFLGTKTRPYDFPGRDGEHPRRASPYNINSDEVHRNVPRITNNHDYGSVYEVFKISDKYANTQWTIYLGEFNIEGQKVTVPPLKLCYHPKKKWIGIEPLMR